MSTRVGTGTMTDCAGTGAALVGFSKRLAHDLAPRGITVDIVQCGHIDIDMNPADAPWAEANAATSAFGRHGTPDEVADGVIALANPRASCITGTVLTVDGRRGAGSRARARQRSTSRVRPSGVGGAFLGVMGTCAPG